ncbi:MAG: hypothetical protein P8K68_01360 [Algibacter sp.]|uniref:hypothetical protein n=1 Tax=Algibacter sp. TaxID=1872428 RepID=UPI00261A70BC|nr:hypothetical protein [Algibacter sp.]MDG1730598.1 hypothetical protein [Algibacter sp.]MDG2177419.1 hypothetical protein [Algibacter sp.]
MIKKLVLVFIAVIAIHGYGQQGTTSPYSFYGIGSLKFKGTVENRSMGGLSIYTDSIHVNLRNPASYAGDNLETWGDESRPVKFAVGGGYTSTNLESSTATDNASSTTFDYLSLNVPLGKFGFGFGLIPYTSVGYKLESINPNGNVDNRFEGEGGVNKAFLGIGYQLAKGLSVGVDFQYNFGNIQNRIDNFQYSDGFPLQNYTQEYNRSDLSGLNINLGISYKTMLNQKLELISGLTFVPESNLTSKNEQSITSVSTLNTLLNKTIETDLADIGLEETDLVLPSRFSFGAGIGEPRKWFVGAETTFLNTSKFSNGISSNNISYEDAYSFSLGGFYIPQFNSFSSYWKRFVYRAGFRAEETGLNINNESIKEFGISFGVGIPVGDARLFSNANLGFEIGQRGTKNSNLIQENFINFQLSLSLNDRWFQKRKYD